MFSVSDYHYENKNAFVFLFYVGGALVLTMFNNNTKSDNSDTS